MKNIYLAGPMTGKPFFNFPAFHAAAKMLRKKGHKVFNPAERDLKKEGDDFAERNPNGDIKQATQQGFSLREALRDDLEYICLTADAIALLPGWRKSKGARAERATAKALGLAVFKLKKNKKGKYVFAGKI